MNWLLRLYDTNSVAHAIGLLSLVCMAGMALGSIKFRGAGLGTAGVLFTGILAGHFGKPINSATLDFVREFGLVLFTFAIGLQLGPGFFATLRRQGLRMNSLAVAIVALGAACAIVIGKLAGTDPAAVLGVFAGASMNMPALGAGTQALASMPNISPERLALPAMACAVTYPGSAIGVIGAIAVIRRILSIDAPREASDFANQSRDKIESLERRTLRVTNPNLAGVRLDSIPGRRETAVTISRVRRGEETLVATGSTALQCDDRILAIGARTSLDDFQRMVGSQTDEDLILPAANITSTRVVVTAKGALGKTIDQLHLGEQFGVAVTRVSRSGIEMSAVPDVHLQFGDTLNIVGAKTDLDRAAASLGNSMKALNETHFIPLFLGIFLGIALGTLPIRIPGFPLPLRLGLAGGPLIVALFVGRVGHIGHLVWYMPTNANLAFRDFGIALFFAAVGLAAGPRFFATVFSTIGARWLLAGLMVTMLPLLLVGVVSRLAWNMNFVELSGLLSGAMTAPPALAFANDLTQSDSPTVAYAMVYPLTMLLRILTAQGLALFLCR